MSRRKNAVRDVHNTVEFTLGHNLAGSVSLSIRTSAGEIDSWLSVKAAHRLAYLLSKEARAASDAAAELMAQRKREMGGAA